MKSFHEFVWLRMPVQDLLRELSEYFPRKGIQDLFDREVHRLRERTNNEEHLRLLDEFGQIDVPAYVDSALKRSGFHESESDSLVSDLCTKLLLGNFFRGWTGQSLVARFKVAVRNAISTLRSRAGKRRKRQSELPDHVVASPRSDDQLVSEFRNFLRMRFGDEVLRVLDHRLAGSGDTKDLVGSPGLETAYKVKRAVSELREAIRIWAEDDPVLTKKLDGIFAQEKRRYDQRFGRVAAAAGRR